MVFPKPPLSKLSSRGALPAAPPHVALARVTRGDATDSIHYGSVAVVDGGGRILYAAGDPSFVTMTRRSLKPLQAVPLGAGGRVQPLRVLERAGLFAGPQPFRRAAPRDRCRRYA